MDRRPSRHRECAHRTLARLLAAVTILAAVMLAWAPDALAGGGGTTGSPQPELKPWNLGTTGGYASGVVLPDGNLVATYFSENGTETYVCVMHPGDRRCRSRATLHAYRGDIFSGVPEVMATGGAEVTVALYDCCNIPNPAAGGAVVFDSSNGGKTFGSERPAGTAPGVSAATFTDNQVVVGDSEAGSLTLQAFSPTPKVTEAASAVLANGDSYDTSITSYKSGALAAWDDSTDSHVDYAIRSSDFNKSSSWRRVGNFANQTVVGISGNALVTNGGGSLTGGNVQLRFFNGRSFGRPFKVPEPKEGNDGYFAMDQAGDKTFVFFENRENSYDLYADVTRNGTRWTREVYGSAIVSAQLVGVLGRIGSGICLEAETSAPPLRAQPLLDGQTVRLKLVKSTKHKTAKLAVTASPALADQLVTLEYRSGHKWRDVGKTAKESPRGDATFKISWKDATYRAVVADDPGYYEYGYANDVTLNIHRR